MALKDHADLGPAANEAISEFPAFRHMNIQLYNKKAGHMTIGKVLLELRVDADVSISSLQHDNLSACFAAYQTTYVDAITEMIAAFEKPKTRNSDKLRLQEKAKDETLKLARVIAPRRSDLCSCKTEVGKMLGFMFAARTMLETTASDGSTAADFRESLWQPHATQVVTIMMLLGVDKPGIPQNHLAEVKTGEGKSVTLAVLSIVFALLGQSVNVVCYNPYLSKRDHEDFKNLFSFFGINSGCVNLDSLPAPDCRIIYCTIDDLVRLLMHDGSLPKVRELALEVLSNRSTPSVAVKYNQRDKVLLIDEVDVFFGRDFFGHCQRVNVVIDDAESQELLRYMFEHRKDLSVKDLDIIMGQSFVKRLTCRYPGLLRGNILKSQIQKMLNDLRDFPADGSIKHDKCHVYQQQHNVGYHDPKIANVNFLATFGYKTYFAYLYYCSTSDKAKKIDIKKSQRQYGLQFLAGYVLYSELPKCFSTILGLSGTVRYLGQNEIKILDQYKFERRSYVPSTFQKSTLSVPFPLLVEESLDQSDFFGKIKTEIFQKIDLGKATLIVFESHATLQSFRQYIQTHPITHPDYKGLPEELHDEMTHNERNGVVSRSTSMCRVTLMTRNFGRGTDFKCHNSLIETAGGMHVILTYLPQSKSEKIQIQGRTCRQDYSGSFREMYWAQDLKNAGYVELSNGKVLLEGYSGLSAKEDLLEAKRRVLDDAEVDKLFECLRLNTELWKKTQDFIASAGLSNLDAALDALKEFQTSAEVGTSRESHTVFIIVYNR
jgi:hypothetical protein